MTAQNPLNRSRFPEVEVEVGSAYECLLTLYAFCDANEEYDYEIGNEWLLQLRSRLSPELHEGLEQIGGNYCKIWDGLIGIVYDCGPSRDVPALIAHIEEMDALELRLHILGYYTGSLRKSMPPEVILRAAEGDGMAQKKFLRTGGGGPDGTRWQRAMRRLLAFDAATTKSTVLDVLRRWYEEFFREQEQQILPILQRDADAKGAIQHMVAPGPFIEQATNGFEYIPEPFTRLVVLVPSFIIRPYVCSVDHQNVMIFCYPVADENLVEDNSAPPQRLVRLYKALADERRLRMLKKLATQCYSLQEMADELGVAKTTLHHHFVILRSSGLVRLRTSDHRYRLREEMLADVSDLLEAYLKRDRSS